MMHSPPRLCDYISQRQSAGTSNSWLEGIQVVDEHLDRHIDFIVGRMEWSAVIKFYHWVCKCVAECLKHDLLQIKETISDQDPPYDTLTQQALEEIRLSDTVYGIMRTLHVLQQWVDIRCLENFYYEHIIQRERSTVPSLNPYTVKLYMEKYKQLVQYMCCRVLLHMKEAPDDLLQMRLQDAKTYLESSVVLAVILDLDYKHFTVDKLQGVQECLEKSLGLPCGHLNYIRSQDGCVAIDWYIDKRYIARIMINVRYIFWRLLEHRVTSLTLLGSLTLSLKGSHVPYLIRDALLSGQDLIQQTEVIIALHVTCSPCMYSGLCTCKY